MKPIRASGEVVIPVGKDRLIGELAAGEAGGPLVIFAHGSGSSRKSPRNQSVARVLQEGGLGTLLFDLLTPEEEENEYFTAHLRFDIDLLAKRLIAATEWALGETILRSSPIGYFGSSTGAAAALTAAANMPEVGAVVSRGGRPDLATDSLPKVRAATLLIVGGRDFGVIELNQKAFDALSCEKELQIIPGATHLFEERGALGKVAQSACDWFVSHLAGRPSEIS